MAGKKKISFRVTDETHEWLRKMGGGQYRGGLQAGFDALVRFAQMTPRAFAAFLRGREFADIGEEIEKCAK